MLLELIPELRDENSEIRSRAFPDLKRVDKFPMTVTGKLQKFKMREAMLEMQRRSQPGPG